MNFKSSKSKKVACLSMKNGFSLVELLIVTAIVVIMTSVALVSRNSSKAAADVETATRQVAAQIRALQNEALGGKKIGADFARKFIFSIDDADPTSYTIKYENAEDAEIIAGTQAIDLASKRVKFESAKTFYFVSLVGVDKASLEVPLVIVSTIDPDVKMYVCVSASGSVEELKILPFPASGKCS